jgi:6-pyruvoyltetrahydropterin/6-carboxytetrahydropterin synthase
MRTSVTKIYPHSLGLSCCFRQWRATSHCHHLHGYALQVELTFDCNLLSDEGWVIDFGSLKPVKEWLQENFDHTLLVAEDDPLLEHFAHLYEQDAARLLVLSHIGCEAFAQHIFEFVSAWVDTTTSSRVWCSKVVVKEHEANEVTFGPS